MKFVSLHTKNTSIVYKNSLCSAASIIVLVFVVLSVMVPVLLVSLLSPYSGIIESRVLHEQPRLRFKHQMIFLAETEIKQQNSGGEHLSNATTELVACSTFPYYNRVMERFGWSCEATKYWPEDLDHDGTADRVHFELQLEHVAGRELKSFDLMLFFDAHLKHKCSLSPPALLTHRLNVPTAWQQLDSGLVRLKAELKLKQYIEFTCPFPGRHAKTHFRDIQLGNKSSSGETAFPAAAGDSIADYQLEMLLQQLKLNPAYFYLDVEETYYRRDPPEHGLRIQLELAVPQLAARYHLSVWERLGQFWLYFASFFGISFYVMNKLKDFLFGRHIVRSWEVIPWKKLY